MALNPYDPQNNPFAQFSSEDQADIKDQLLALKGSGKLNSAQDAGVTRALRYFGVDPGPLELPGMPKPGLGNTSASTFWRSANAPTTRTRATITRPSGLSRPADAGLRLTAEEAERRGQANGVLPKQLQEFEAYDPFAGPTTANPTIPTGDTTTAVHEPGELQAADVRLKNFAATLPANVRERFLAQPWVNRNLTDPLIRERAAGDLEAMGLANPGTVAMGEAGLYGPLTMWEGAQKIADGRVLEGTNEQIEGAFETLKPLITAGRFYAPVGTEQALAAAELGGKLGTKATSLVTDNPELQRLGGNFGTFAFGASMAGRGAWRKYRQGVFTKLVEENMARGLDQNAAIQAAELQMSKFKATGDARTVDVAVPRQAAGELQAKPLVTVKEATQGALTGAAAAAKEPIKGREEEPAEGVLKADVTPQVAPPIESVLPEAKKGSFLDRVRKKGEGTVASESNAHNLGQAAFGQDGYEVIPQADGRFTVRRKGETASAGKTPSQPTEQPTPQVKTTPLPETKAKKAEVSQSAKPAEPTLAESQKALETQQVATTASQKLRQQIAAIPGITNTHTDAVMALLEGNAKYHGMNLDAYVDKFYAGIKQGGQVGKAALFQAENDLGFKSKAEEVINTLPAKMTGEQAFATLINKGVKREELAWTGLFDLLQERGKQPVSKGELQQLMREHGVQLNEVTNAENGAGATELAQARIELDNLEREWTRRVHDLNTVIQDVPNTPTGPHGIAPSGHIQNLLNASRGSAEAKEWLSSFLKPEVIADHEAFGQKLRAANDRVLALEDAHAGGTRYSDYSVPGGKNYREFLLQMPQQRASWHEYLKRNFRADITEAEAHELWGQNRNGEAGHLWDSFNSNRPEGQYNSPHWDEPNVLVHVRTTDRTDAEGKKVLFVEEIQSDWHQHGRDEGYKPKPTSWAELQAKGYTTRLMSSERMRSLGLVGEGTVEVVDPTGNPVAHGWDLQNAREMAVRNVNNEFGRGVPDAPFKDTWHELAIKRILRRAAEEGYDRVAFSPAEVHTNRWGTELAAWKKGEKETDPAFYLNFKPQVRGRVNHHGAWIDLEVEAARQGFGQYGERSSAIFTKEDLARSVGQHLKPAQIDRLWERMQKEPEGVAMPRKEGFDAFYDAKIPNYLKKFGKKFGAQLGQTEIDTRVESTLAQDKLREAAGLAQHTQSALYLDITPSMKKSVMEEGQYLFQKQGAIKKGAVEFAEDGRALITAFNKADVSTLAHEVSHVFERNMKAEDRAVAEKWLGVVDGNWTEQHKEWFARGFERYLREGKAPNEGLQKVFENFKTWLTDIYKKLVTGAPALNNDARALYGKLLGVDNPTIEEARPSTHEKAKTLDGKEARLTKAEQHQNNVVALEGEIAKRRAEQEQLNRRLARKDAIRWRVDKEGKKVKAPQMNEAQVKWANERLAALTAELSDLQQKHAVQVRLRDENVAAPAEPGRPGRPITRDQQGPLPAATAAPATPKTGLPEMTLGEGGSKKAAPAQTAEPTNPYALKPKVNPPLPEIRFAEPTEKVEVLSKATGNRDSQQVEVVDGKTLRIRGGLKDHGLVGEAPYDPKRRVQSIAAANRDLQLKVAQHRQAHPQDVFDGDLSTSARTAVFVEHGQLTLIDPDTRLTTQIPWDPNKSVADNKKALYRAHEQTEAQANAAAENRAQFNQLSPADQALYQHAQRVLRTLEEGKSRKKVENQIEDALDEWGIQDKTERAKIAQIVLAARSGKTPEAVAAEQVAMPETANVPEPIAPTSAVKTPSPEPIINPDAVYTDKLQAEFAGKKLHGEGNFIIAESHEVTGRKKYKAVAKGTAAGATLPTAVAPKPPQHMASAEPTVAPEPKGVKNGDSVKATRPNGTVIEGKVIDDQPNKNGFIKIQVDKDTSAYVKPEWIAREGAPVAEVAKPAEVAVPEPIKPPVVEHTEAPSVPVTPEKPVEVETPEQELARLKAALGTQVPVQSEGVLPADVTPSVPQVIAPRPAATVEPVDALRRIHDQLAKGGDLTPRVLEILDQFNLRKDNQSLADLMTAINRKIGSLKRAAKPKAAVPEKSFLVKKIESEVKSLEKAVAKAQAAGDTDKADALAGALAGKKERLAKIKEGSYERKATAPTAPATPQAEPAKPVAAPNAPEPTTAAQTVKQPQLTEKAQRSLEAKQRVLGDYPFAEDMVTELENFVRGNGDWNNELKHEVFTKAMEVLHKGLDNQDERWGQKAFDVVLNARGKNQAGYVGTTPRRFRLGARQVAAISKAHVMQKIGDWTNLTDSELALGKIADKLSDPMFEREVELANDPNLTRAYEKLRDRAGSASYKDPIRELTKVLDYTDARGQQASQEFSAAELARGAKREHLAEAARAKETLYHELGNTPRYKTDMGRVEYAWEWAKTKAGRESKIRGAIEQWDQKSVRDSVAFIDKMEHGDFEGMNAEDRALAQKLRELLDDRRNQIYGLGEGIFEKYLENYFPHIWTDPKLGRDLVHRILGSKRPLGGPEGFRKPRTIEFFAEGLKEQRIEDPLTGEVKTRPALTPVTYNPVKMALLRIHEMDRFLMAHRIKADLKAQDLIKFYRNEAEVPYGWVKLEDRVFSSKRPIESYSPVEDAPGLYTKDPGIQGFQHNGDYYAPKDAAKVINNYLKPGLQGRSKLFDFVRGYGNALNQAQLGISAFHLTFTGLIDSPTSTVALGIEQAARGFLKADKPAFKQGLANIGTGMTILGASISTIRHGNKMLAEYLDPGRFNEYSRAVEALVEAGGRVRMDPYYKNNAIEGFRRTAKEMRHLLTNQEMSKLQRATKLTPKALGMVFRTATAGLELASKPVMEVLVPRMKLGLFYKMAEEVLMKLGPDAPHEVIRAELGKAWDSVDNRMGQVVYDNLDWSRTAKDIAMLSIRSVGWNYGTWREVGGAGIYSKEAGLGGDLRAGIGKAIKTRNWRNFEVTRRMAYLPALVAYVGFLGAMTNYFNTRELPKDSDDLFFPRTGNVNPDGTPERVEWASYMKDLYPLFVGTYKTGKNLGLAAGLKRAGVMFGHKIHPWIGQTAELYDNKDYYGVEIVHTGDKSYQQVWQAAAHYLKGFEPLTFKNARERRRSDASFAGQVGAGFGLVPAPKWLGNTPAMEYAFEMAKRKMEAGPMTSDKFQQRQFLNQLEMRLTTKRIKPAAIYQAAKEGKITLDQADSLFDDMRETDPLRRHFKRLGDEGTDPTQWTALETWRRANKDEQKRLSDMMQDKLDNALDSLSPDQAREYFRRYRQFTKR